MILKNSFTRKILLLILLFAVTSCTVMGMRDIPLHKLNQKYATGASRYINVNGTLVHYRDEGNPKGPTLLLVHGIMDSLHTWDGWHKELKNDYRIVRLDLPGFGLTGPFTPNGVKEKDIYTRKTYMKFMDNFIKTMGLKDVYLAGNSLGGGIAWYYAVHNPSVIKKLILLDPAGYNMKKVPFPVRLLTTPVIGQMSRLVAPKFMFTINVGAVYGDPARIQQKEVDRFFEMALRPGNRKAMISIFKLLKYLAANSTYHQNIPNLKMPVLVIWGKKDIWIPFKQQSALWQKNLPGARYVFFDDLGHVPHLEAPIRTAKIARKFILEGK